MNPYEAIGVLFGIVSVWLIARQNVWGWPAGLVNVVLFIVVFHGARLYAAMGLQVVYVALSIYGWYSWRRGGPGHGGLRVRRAPARLLAALISLGAVSAIVLGTTLHRHTDASLPFLDASLTSFSLVAQGMQARKLIENWVLWLAVDVCYVAMYAYKALFLTAGLYAVFFGLAVMGYVEWRRSMSHWSPTC
jgi:nicotinamide mononucleotide transporter